MLLMQPPKELFVYKQRLFFNWILGKDFNHYLLLVSTVAFQIYPLTSYLVSNHAPPPPPPTMLHVN